MARYRGSVLRTLMPRRGLLGRNQTQLFRIETAVSDDSVAMYVPLASEGDLLECWLRLSYHRSDPLAIGIALCSPARAVALERTCLRSDLRSALYTRISYPDLVIRPDAAGDNVAMLFTEGEASVNAVIPRSEVARFLRDTDLLVLPGTHELEALNEAALELTGGQTIGEANA